MIGKEIKKTGLVMNVEGLGRLVVKVHPRAKRLVFRVKSDAICASVPPGTTVEMVEQAVGSLRHRLAMSLQQASRPPIDVNYKIDTEYFKLSVVLGERNTFFANSRPGDMQIVCPPDTDFTDERLQQWLHSVIEKALKQQAYRVLSLRLAHLSRQCGLPYKNMKVSCSRGRWGSCSARKNINLSCYLLLLPAHLMDYVLLHELCHTREMNHGAAFWELLNQFTEGKALALRKELREHNTVI